MSINHTIVKFLIISAATVILFCCQRNEPENFYISNNGNDKESGLSPNRAWKTIEKLNRVNLIPGDTVFFKAGGKWRETLKITNSGSGNNLIVYTKYGNGKNPRILGSESEREFTSTNHKNVWKCKTKLHNPVKGTFPSEIFFLNISDSISWGLFKDYDPVFKNLKNENDWTWHNGSIYFYLDSNPDSVYQSIEIPQRNSCISMNPRNPSEFIEINELDFFFAKSTGFYGGNSRNKSSTLIFKNLHVGWIGRKNGDTSYGLSVSHSKLLVDRCEINDCGRRGISYNLYPNTIIKIFFKSTILKRSLSNVLRKHGIRYNDITIKNCYFHNGNHTTSLDLAAMPECLGALITNVYFHNNIIEEDTTIIIGQNGNHTSNQIFTQEGGAHINNVFIFNNIFKNTTARHILIEGCDSVYIWNNTIYGFNQNGIPNPYASVSFNHTKGVDLRNNIFYLNLPEKIVDHGILMYYSDSKYLKRDYNLYFQKCPNKDFTGGKHGYFKINQWDSYLKKNPGFDKHSPHPENPLLKKDFSPGKYSPALGKGILIEKTHLQITPKSSKINIGAMQ